MAIISVLVILLHLLGQSAAIYTISIKGAKFFDDATGDQFFIKGVDYQQRVEPPEYIDPLSDGSACQRDAPYIAKLGMNTIRAYNIDPTQDHDDCMSIFSDANIYVFVDLTSPDEVIDRDLPAWDTALYARYASVIDSMQGYDNMLGFFAGNEVANAPNNTASAPFVKAAIRDMKQYINDQGYRNIPVGYTMADNVITENMADYLNCGQQDVTTDFFALNIYSWCGTSSYTDSGYDLIANELDDYSKPTFFAEYGCNTLPGPRPFDEVQAIYGDMDVLSGGLAYEYFEETNDFGLVSVDGNSVSTLADYNNLRTQLASVSPVGEGKSYYTPTNAPAPCPILGSQWSATSVLPPTPSETLCNCMYSSLSCIVDPSTAADTYFDTVTYICGSGTDCSAIAANGTLGTYGRFSMCNSTQQLGYIMDQYYTTQSTCDFGGAGRTQSAAQPTDQCKVLLSQGTTGSPSTVSNAASASSGSSGDGGSLSDGAKTGIGVGVGVGAVFILAGVATTLVIRRRRRAGRSQDSAEKDVSATDPAVMLANDSQRYELEQAKAEMPSERGEQELPAGRGNSELGRSATTGPTGIESRHELPSSVNGVS